MTDSQKERFRQTPEYQAITWWRDCERILTHNCSVTTYKIKMGQIPWGKVERWDGTFVAPVPEPNSIPRWSPSYGHYHVGQKTHKFQSAVAPVDRKSQSTGEKDDDEEVPF